MTPNPQRIINIANAFFESCVLFTATDLGIFDCIAKIKEADCTTIANMLSINKTAAERLLDACVALDLLRKENNHYSLTDESEAYLTSKSMSNLSGALRYNRDVYSAWGKLREYITNGTPVEKPELHLGKDKERTRAFVLSMHYRVLAIGRIVVPQLDLSGKKRLLDVGGGPGTFSMLIAQSNPSITCIVLDLPDIVKIAEELIEKQHMSHQVKTFSGDYHSTDFPPENDIINFFGVLHQESPDTIKNLLNRAYHSLNPAGAVNVMDMMTDAARTAPKFSALFSLNMALTTENGWVFSDTDMKEWCMKAGFIDFSVKPVGGFMPHWLATARKPSS